MVVEDVEGAVVVVMVKVVVVVGLELVVGLDAAIVELEVVGTVVVVGVGVVVVVVAVVVAAVVVVVVVDRTHSKWGSPFRWEYYLGRIVLPEERFVCSTGLGPDRPGSGEEPSVWLRPSRTSFPRATTDASS